MMSVNRKYGACPGFPLVTVPVSLGKRYLTPFPATFPGEMRLSVYLIEPLFNGVRRRVFPSDIRRCAPRAGRGRH